MKRTLLALLALLEGLSASAQDPQFSQLNLASQYLNPAFSGYGISGGAWRFTVTHRSQWTDVAGNYKTDYFAYERMFDPRPAGNRNQTSGFFAWLGNNYARLWGYHDKKNVPTKSLGGFAVYALNDNSGDIRYNPLNRHDWKIQTLRFGGSASIDKKLGSAQHPEAFLGRLGVELGLTQRKLDDRALVFYDQITGNGEIGRETDEQLPDFRPYRQINFGVGFFFRIDALAKKSNQALLFIPGFAVANFSKNRREFIYTYKIPRVRYTGQLTTIYRWKTSSTSHLFDQTVMLSGFYRHQKDNEFLDASAQYYYRIVGGGIGYRTIPSQEAEALSLHAALNLPMDRWGEKFKFDPWLVCTYDVTLGRKAGRIGNSIEVGLILTRSKTIPCPGGEADGNEKASRYRYPL